MKHSIYYLLSLLLITGILTSCDTTSSDSDTDPEPEEPTREELLAQIHGSSDTQTWVYKMSDGSEITAENSTSSFYPDDEGNLIFYGLTNGGDTDQWIKIKPQTVEKEGDLIIVTDSSSLDNIYWSHGWDEGNLNGDDLRNAVVEYNTETHRYTFSFTLAEVAETEISALLDPNGEPVEWNVSQAPSNAKRTKISSRPPNPVTPLAISLTGVKPVHVNLHPNTTFAQLVANTFNPEGDHYVTFTSLGSDNYQIEFCNAAGDVIVAQEGGTGFHGGTMPMKLYFLDVRLNYANDTISDANNGNNHVEALPCTDCDAGSIPSWLLPVIEPNGIESTSAEVLSTAQSGDAFYIEVDLNLPLDFTAQITEL